MYMTLEKALKIMNLTQPFTEDDLKKSYRQKAKTCHPDYFQGDAKKEEEFKEINAANSMLLEYLKNPNKARAESDRNAAYKRQDDENERRRQEAAKHEEERKRQEEANRRYQEAEKKRQKQEEERKKRQEEVEKFERRKNAYHKIDLFNLSGISENDYIYNSEKRQKLDNIYSSIKFCYDNVEKRIDSYKHKKQNIGVNPLSKENLERKKEIKDYETRLRSEFSDMAEAAKTYFRCYGEYFEYGFVLGKIKEKDLEDYIFADNAYRKTIKKMATDKLKEYAKLQINFLNAVEASEMKEIDPNKRARDYYEEIALQQEIENYVNNNFEIYRNKIAIKPSSDIYASRILNGFIKTSFGDTPDLMSMRLFLSQIINMASIINDKCPEISLFDLIDNYQKVASIANNFELTKKFYKLIYNKHFDVCYKCFNNIKDRLELYNFEDIYNAILMIMNKYNKLSTIRSYNRQITLEELVLMSESEYLRLIKETEANNATYNESVKSNPEIKEHQEIYNTYPNLFKNMTYQKAMDYIAAKCEYLKRLGLKDKIVDLFILSEEELNKKIVRQKRREKIEFIVLRNPEYKFSIQNPKQIFLDFENDPYNRLEKLNDEQLNQVYKDTFIMYVNANHPEIKITPDYYDKLNDESRTCLLEDIEFNLKLKDLAKRSKYVYPNRPLTFEEVRNLDGEELNKLERMIISAETESFFSGGNHRH